MAWLLFDARTALVVGAIMLAVSLLFRPAGRFGAARFVAAATFEIGFVCSLFGLWQVANRLARGHTTNGLQRGKDIWHAEQWLHLPSEVSIQHLIIHHSTVVRAANYYYDTMHLTTMFVFLIWLWLRHRDRYPFFRNMLVFFTAMSLLIQMIAVAPPRLIGIPGLIDTPAAYNQSVYAAFGDLADQYAAMPSIHVGWAVLVSYAVVKASPSRFRWLAILHGAITCFVVVATGNHYILDGVVAVVLLVFAYYLAKAVDRIKLRLMTSEPVLPELLVPNDVTALSLER